VVICSQLLDGVCVSLLLHFTWLTRKTTFSLRECYCHYVTVIFRPHGLIGASAWRYFPSTSSDCVLLLQFLCFVHFCFKFYYIGDCNVCNFSRPSFKIL